MFVQFVLFLLIGTMLFVYYTQHAPQEIAAFMRDGRVQTDRIFPYFIVRHLPPGVVGTRARRDLRGRDVHAVLVAQFVVGGGGERLLRPCHEPASQRRALPARLAGDDRRLGRHPDRRGHRRHLAVEPRRGRSARHRVVHQRRHPRRVPARHVHDARGAARRVRRHPRAARSSCST